MQTLREVFGGLKRRRPTRKYCPQCGDPGVHLSSRFDLWLFPEKYACEKCGYTGPLVLEIDDDEQKKQPQ
jgi:ribosomal protein S27AE